jgi:hypothetical protein
MTMETKRRKVGQIENQLLSTLRKIKNWFNKIGALRKTAENKTALERGQLVTI